MKEQRVLARKLTRELTMEELEMVSGGAKKVTGKATWSQQSGSDAEVDFEIDF